MLSLGNEFISSHLDVLIEQVTSEYLLSIFEIQLLGVGQRNTDKNLVNEGHVLVMQEVVVVEQPQERENTNGGGLSFIHIVINVQVCHIIIPFWIRWVQEQSWEWELWADSANNVEKIKHLFNRLVSLLSHTSMNGKVSLIDSEECHGCEVSLHI